MKIKKNLCGEGLLKLCRDEFKQIPDHRGTCGISLVDALMSALAVFKLKMPSLLQFDKQRADENHLQNIRNIFSVKNVPSDTQLREILDPVDSRKLDGPFKAIIRLLQSEKVLSEFKYNIPGHKELYVTPVDGTGYFASSNIRCENCLMKTLKGENGEEKYLYHHQMLGAGIVHPDKKTVIPLFPEPIVLQDGNAKNDCERNAGKRLFHRLKDSHPGLPFLIVGDALYSTIPNIELIKANAWNYLFSVKPLSHRTVFELAKNQSSRAKTTVVQDEIGDKIKKKRIRTYRYVNQVFLTYDSDVLVNFLDFEETIEWVNKEGPQQERVHYTWITDIKIDEYNIYQLMRAGRARWKAENEVFNTLKNQGYNLEHNYGHGKKNLNVNFAILMYLAFAIDQLEETCCELFQAARKRFSGRPALWLGIHGAFHYFSISSWTELLKIAVGKVRPIDSGTIDTC